MCFIVLLHFHASHAVCIFMLHMIWLYIAVMLKIASLSCWYYLMLWPKNLLKSFLELGLPTGHFGWSAKGFACLKGVFFTGHLHPFDCIKPISFRCTHGQVRCTVHATSYQQNGHASSFTMRDCSPASSSVSDRSPVVTLPFQHNLVQRFWMSIVHIICQLPTRIWWPVSHMSMGPPLVTFSAYSV